MTKEGWLFVKLGPPMKKRWKKRWASTDGGSLILSAVRRGRQTQVHPLGRAVLIETEGGKVNSFSVRLTTSDALHKASDSLDLAAETSEEKFCWMEVLDGRAVRKKSVGVFVLFMQ